MRVVLLGAAAGGGLPQWNCSCRNCASARTGSIPVSTQSCVAFTADDRHWFLVNASPDLPRQIEATPFLHPQPGQARCSPLDGVLLTNADLDHVLGLVLLREGGPLQIHAPAGVREALATGLNFEALIGAFGGVHWTKPSQTELQPLLWRDGENSGLNYRAHHLSDDPPRYAPSACGTQSVAYEIVDPTTGGRMIVAPDVATIPKAFLNVLHEADALFFDGTFWSNDELGRYQNEARTAEQMGHLPISTGSLDVLRKLPAVHKVYMHINNTNPVWQPESDERKTVEQAGLRIGFDGLEITL